jgi:predicted transcriptional regulator
VGRLDGSRFFGRGTRQGLAATPNLRRCGALHRQRCAVAGSRRYALRPDTPTDEVKCLHFHVMSKIARAVGARAELRPDGESEKLQNVLQEPRMTPTTKERIREVADRLPPDATIEDAIERLVFLTKIDRGLTEANAGQLIDHEEVEREFGR